MITQSGLDLLEDAIKTVKEAEGLQAIGRVLSKKNLQDLKEAVTVLQELIKRGEATEETEVAIEGNEVQLHPKSRTLVAAPIITLTADGMMLTAGERLGTLLKRARVAKGLSTGQVATELPISQRTYELIEMGSNMTSKLPDDILQAICTALDISFDDASSAGELDQEQPVGQPAIRY